ncbi:MAG: acyl--CoA ligase [Christensenellaceae bacterium]|nr:acyl--CoA ligase [Christensenellaceae bacterium]
MKIDQSMYMYLKEGCTDPLSTKLIYFNRTFTAQEMFYEIKRVASYLLSLGVEPGDVVSIALPNMPEAIFSLYGINAVNAVANLIHPQITVAGLKKLMKSTRSKVIFIYDKLYDQVKEIKCFTNMNCIVCSVSTRMKSLYKCIVYFTEPKLRKIFRYDDMPTDFVFEPQEGRADLPAAYIHSGGTTGSPKTVVLSNGALNSLSNDIIDSLYPDPNNLYKPTDCMLMCLPIFHGFGLGVCVHTLLPRAHLVLLPLFRASMAIKAMKKYKISHMAGVPAMYRMILDNRKFKGDFSSLSHVFCGADKLPVDLKTRFDNKLRELGSSAELLEGYGLTETTTVFSLNRPGMTKPKSQGQPLIGNEVAVFDLEGQPLPIGESGELYLKAKAVMTEYLNDRESTKLAIVNIDGNQWLKTGDFGYIDEDKHIYFKDRIKRSIKIAAVNVFPAEVEELVTEMEEIDECCVARTETEGKPHTLLFVVLKEGFELNSRLQKKIKTTIADNLMHYAVPKNIIEKESLYHTAIGKVDYVKYEKELKNSAAK